MNDPRIAQYESRHQCRLFEALGSGAGQDGIVFRSDRVTAVKLFDSEHRFRRELEVYHLLRAKGIQNVAGHHVPLLVDEDEQLRAIEMTLVDRPFLLDFAGAKRPEEVPDFEQHVLDEHLDRMREMFEDRWGDALHVVEMFRQATGFVLLDIHPGNVAFKDPQ